MKKLLLTLLILLMACPSWAATYYVRADGTVLTAAKANATSCSAASSALNVAEFNKTTFSPGDTVNFCTDGGEYTSTIVPVSDGTAGARITYNGDADGDGVKAHIQVSGNIGISCLDTCSYTDIRGFDIDTGTEGVRVYANTKNISTPRIIFNNIHDLSNRGIYLVGNNTNETYVESPEVGYNTVYAIGTDTADSCVTLSVRITNSWIHHNDLYGTASAGVDGILAEHLGGGNVIEYNTIHDFTATGAEDGIDLKFAPITTATQVSEYQTIRNNDIYGNTNQSGITCQFGIKYVNIYNNKLHSNGTGLLLRGGSSDPPSYLTTYITVYNNLIYDNTSRGISMDQSSGNYIGYFDIYNNTIASNGYAATTYAYTGIYVDYGHDINIRNNILYDNRAGSASYRHNIRVNNWVTDVSLDYNMHYHSRGTATVWWDGAYRTISTLQNTYSQETHGSESDPLFASSTNFSLLPGSPAINGGVNVCTAEGVPYSTCTGSGTGYWFDRDGHKVPDAYNRIPIGSSAPGIGQHLMDLRPGRTILQ